MSPWAVRMFVYNDLRTDARVRREASALARAGYRVTVVGRGSIGLPSAEEVDGFRLLRTPARDGGIGPGGSSPWRVHHRRGIVARLRWLFGYARDFKTWRAAALALVAADGPPTGRTVWHGHDLTGVAVADRARARWDGRVLYDSHELYLEAGSAARLPPLARRALAGFERRLIRRADAVITVNGSVARELAGRYGIRPPLLVMNCPAIPEAVPDRQASPLRAALDVRDRAVVLHHGGIAEGRGIRVAVEALRDLPAEVVLVLLGDGELVPELRALSETDAYRGRLLLHPAIPPDVLLDWVAGADLGLVTFENVDMNNYLGTPNKLFECLAAGVPVVVSDFPEMREIVVSDDLGAVCDPTSPGSVSAAIRLLLAEPTEVASARRRRCRSVAAERYSWSAQESILLGVYESLTAGGQRLS